MSFRQLESLVLVELRTWKKDDQNAAKRGIRIGQYITWMRKKPEFTNLKGWCEKNKVNRRYAYRALVLYDYWRDDPQQAAEMGFVAALKKAEEAKAQKSNRPPRIRSTNREAVRRTKGDVEEPPSKTTLKTGSVVRDTNDGKGRGEKHEGSNKTARTATPVKSLREQFPETPDEKELQAAAAFVEACEGSGRAAYVLLYILEQERSDDLGKAERLARHAGVEVGQVTYRARGGFHRTQSVCTGPIFIRRAGKRRRATASTHEKREVSP